MSSEEIISVEETEKQAQIARRYANLIGVMPATFSSAIKELTMDDGKGEQRLSERSEFQVGRVLRGPTALSLLYWATKTIYPEKMPPGWVYSPLQISRLYHPSTLASILAYTYLFKRIKRIVNSEEWQFISRPLQKNLEITSLLGAATSNVGCTAGLLGGGMIFIAFACFSAHDRKGFGEYRRHLKISKMFQDSDYERKVWGCTSVQIAAQLILQAGFGVPLSHQFLEGFRDSESIAHSTRAKNPFSIVRYWLSEMTNSKGDTAEKDTAGETSGFLNVEMTPDLINKLKLVNREGSLYNWLEKGADDIGPDKTPDLLLDEVVFK